MEVKEYLKQIKNIDLEIQNCKLEIEYLKELSCSIPACSIKEFVDKSSSTDSTFEKVLLKIDELERNNIERIDKLLELRENIKNVIGGVSDSDERNILYQRYVCNRTWSDIGYMLGYDEKTVRRKHIKACEKIKI